MSYTVRVNPGPVVCGKCGQGMHSEEMKRDASVAVLSCWNLQCEQHDVRLLFPLPFTELQKADA